jgi:hypothetical protein
MPADYGEKKPFVEGRLIDVEGNPIEGAIIQAVLIEASGGGNMHSSVNWDTVAARDRFITDRYGEYSGRLSFDDTTLDNASKKAVFYYTCKDGFQPFALLRAKRGTVVVRRTSDTRLAALPSDYERAILAGGCK